MKAILAEMQKEIWVMEPRALDALFARVLEINISPNLAEVEIEQSPKLSITGDTAVILIRGILMKRIPFLFRLFGIETTSYLDIQRQIEEALGNDGIKKILLDIDSPGGKVAGAIETGQAIAEAASQKKVTARIEDLGASGAYWLASQASKIIAGPNAEIGAIGVFTVFVDYSKMAENEGVRVHVIRSGEHKGMGVPGAKITDSQISAVQKRVDGIADNFIKEVSSGRGMSVEAVRELADGRLFLATEAKRNGLIDNVIKQAKKATSNMKGMNMDENEKNRLSDLEAAFPEDQQFVMEQFKAGHSVEQAKIAYNVNLEAVREQADEEGRKRLASLSEAFGDDPQFVLEQFKASATVEQAKAAYCDVLTERLTEAKKEIEKLQKKIEALDSASPIISAGEGDSDSGFMTAARQLAKDEKISVTEAMKRVKKDNPELYEAYISQAQQQKVA